FPSSSNNSTYKPLSGSPLKYSTVKIVILFKFVFSFVQPSKKTANNPKVKIIPLFLISHTSSVIITLLIMNITNNYGEIMD
ncbi:MAG TPA: hypothetical protein DDY89_20790, partial [Lysinibacillus sp.]|nr:hypothetical protein [Lysinibacillus sp.]